MKLRTIEIVVATACALTSACTAREPVYAASELRSGAIDAIAVAPIIDVRTDAFRDVEVVGHVRRTVDNALSEKGYAVTPAGLEHGGDRYGASEIGRMTDAQLAASAPPDVRYVMIVNVDRVERDVDEAGRTVAVKLSGRLFDVRAQRDLWRDTAEGDADLGGLLAILTGPAPDYEAAYDASRSLFSTLPDGPGRARSQAVTTVQGETTPAPAGGMRPGQER